MWAGFSALVKVQKMNPNHDPSTGEFTSGGGGSKVTTFTHTNGHSYTTTHAADGTPLKLKGHYTDKNGVATTHTLWNAENGTAPSKNTVALMQAGLQNSAATGASPETPTVVTDGQGNAAEYTLKGAVYDGTPPIGTVNGYDDNKSFEDRPYSDTKAKMEVYGSKVRATLTDSQSAALDRYMGSGYRSMNADLRAGAKNSYCDTLLSAFNSPLAVLPVPVIANRGIHADTMSTLFPDGPKVGAVLGDAGFMSASWDQKFSARWADIDYGSKGAVFQFTLPKGSPALVPSYQGEHEIVLPPNSAIRIDSVEPYPDHPDGLLIKGTYLGTKS